MAKTRALKAINPLIGLLLLSQMITGIMGRDMPPQLFGAIHKGGGLLLFMLVVVHLVLNWPWVRANYSRTARKKG